MLTPVRRRLAALALVLLLPALGACRYQTDQVYQPGVGVNNRAGTVDVLGAVVVSPAKGEGTFVASLANKSLDQSDQLTSVVGNTVEAKVATPVEIKPATLVNLADAGAVSVTGEGVEAGSFVRLTLTFANGQTTKMNVPVVRADEEFADIKPATPSGSPSASPSGSPTP